MANAPVKKEVAKKEIAKKKESDDDDDSSDDSDEDDPAKKPAITPKVVAAAPKPTAPDSSSEDSSSEDEKKTIASKPMVKTAPQHKADSSSEDSSSEDGAKKAQEMALNNLKSQVIDMKAKLCQCIYVKSSTEEEIEKILAKCQELSDWIEEEATVDTEVDVLEEKLKELTDLTASLHARVKQHKE